MLLQAETLTDNPASQRVLRRCGFVHHGRAPEYLKIDGRLQTNDVDWTLNEGSMLSDANPFGPPMGVGCTATVSCAATTNGRSPLALGAGTVAGSGTTVACTSAKGGCPASVISQSGTQSGATSPGSDSFSGRGPNALGMAFGVLALGGAMETFDFLAVGTVEVFGTLGLGAAIAVGGVAVLALVVVGIMGYAIYDQYSN